MQRNSTISHGSNIIAKPPRPPCWRDFVTESAEPDSFKTIDFADLGKLQQKSGLQGVPILPGLEDGFPCLTSEHVHTVLCEPNCHTSSRLGKHGKRVRSKLHRTRSQMLIQEEDLPDVSLAVNLGETKPREFGIKVDRRQVYDSRIYLEENTKRCRNWLASVEACQPLDDTVFAQGSGVDIEIPEECWESMADLRPPHNSSASSSDNEFELIEVVQTTKFKTELSTSRKCHLTLPENNDDTNFNSAAVVNVCSSESTITTKSVQKGILRNSKNAKRAKQKYGTDVG